MIGSMDDGQRRRLLDEPAALDRAVGPRARLRARDRGRHRRARRLADDGRVVSGSWTSTLLWLIPLGGALLVVVLPLRDATRGALALIATLATDRARTRRRRSTSTRRAERSSSSRTPGCATSGLTYHVGMDGLSLVLVALTAVCVPCALGFGLWAKRPEHARLRGAHAPAGVRGRPAARGARSRALLRRLRGDDRPARAADRGLGRPEPRARLDPLRDLHARRLAADADRRDHARAAGRLVRPGEDRHERLALAVPRVHGRVRDQGAALPVPRLGAGRLPRVAARGRGAALGRRLEGGRLRHAALRAAALPRPCARPAALVRRDRARRACCGARSWPSANRTRAGWWPTRRSAR